MFKEDLQLEVFRAGPTRNDGHSPLQQDLREDFPTLDVEGSSPAFADRVGFCPFQLEVDLVSFLLEAPLEPNVVQSDELLHPREYTRTIIMDL